MQIFVNGDKHQLTTGNRLSDLSKELGIEEAIGVAIAVENKVVPKNQWNEFELQENVNILVIRAAQGG